MFPFKKIMWTDFSLLIPAKKKSSPSSAHNGHPDRKRDCDYVTAIRPTTTTGSINTESAFYREGQKAPGELIGSSIPPGYLLKVAICGSALRSKQSHLLPWDYVTPKTYWLSENNPITPYVCRGEELGKVFNLLEIKIQYLPTPQASNPLCIMQRQVHRSPKFLSHLSPCACHLKDVEGLHFSLRKWKHLGKMLS